MDPKRYTRSEKYLGLHLSDEQFFGLIDQLEDFGDRWALENPDAFRNPFLKQRQDMLEHLLFLNYI